MCVNILYFLLSALQKVRWGKGEPWVMLCTLSPPRMISALKWWGSDGSHKDVSLTVRNKVARQCPLISLKEIYLVVM